MRPTHPVGERAAAAFHTAFVLLYAVLIGFHGACALAHWRERWRDG